MGYTVDQGISARLLESRVGGEEYFSRLEYFLDMDCIVVLPKHEFRFIPSALDQRTQAEER